MLALFKYSWLCILVIWFINLHLVIHSLFELHFFKLQTNLHNEENFERKAKKIRPSVKQTKQDHITSVIICHR